MPQHNVPLTVHGMSLSGNCYKVKRLLDQLGGPYRWIGVDSANRPLPCRSVH